VLPFLQPTYCFLLVALIIIGVSLLTMRFRIVAGLFCFLLCFWAMAKTEVAPVSGGAEESAFPEDKAEQSRQQANVAEACSKMINEWLAQRRVALNALHVCEYTLYHDECMKLRKLTDRATAKDSPCLKSGVGKRLKLPNMNCEVVSVPDGCGKK
jgi:hypothetical protein